MITKGGMWSYSRGVKHMEEDMGQGEQLGRANKEKAEGVVPRVCRYAKAVKRGTVTVEPTITNMNNSLVEGEDKHVSL